MICPGVCLVRIVHPSLIAASATVITPRPLARRSRPFLDKTDTAGPPTPSLALLADGSLHQPAQEGHSFSNGGQAVDTDLVLDGQPAPVSDFLEHPHVPHPVDVTAAQRHLLGCTAGAASTHVSGVAVQDVALQGAGAGNWV